MEECGYELNWIRINSQHSKTSKCDSFDLKCLIRKRDSKVFWEFREVLRQIGCQNGSKKHANQVHLWIKSHKAKVALLSEALEVPYDEIFLPPIKSILEHARRDGVAKANVVVGDSRNDWLISMVGLIVLLQSCMVELKPKDRRTNDDGARVCCVDCFANCCHPSQNMNNSFKNMRQEKLQAYALCLQTVHLADT